MYPGMEQHFGIAFRSEPDAEPVFDNRSQFPEIIDFAIENDSISFFFIEHGLVGILTRIYYRQAPVAKSNTVIEPGPLGIRSTMGKFVDGTLQIDEVESSGLIKRI
jgi:hypothetical protein